MVYAGAGGEAVFTRLESWCRRKKEKCTSTGQLRFPCEGQWVHYKMNG